MSINKTNIYKTLDSIDEFWSQKVLFKANGSMFKVAKGVGGVNWHKHDDQDEVFYVLKGAITIRFKEAENVLLKKGDMLVVPKGVEHSPFAENYVELLVVGKNITSNSKGGKPKWSFS